MGLPINQLTPAEIEAQFTVRPATLTDLDRALEFFNFVSQQITGELEMRREKLELEWRREGLILENNARLILTPADEIIAFVQVWDLRAPYTELYIWVVIHPHYENSGVGEYLIQWGETRLLQSLPKAPDGAKVMMRIGLNAKDKAGQNAALAQGMELVRIFSRMALEFNDPPPVPVWPNGITLRPFSKGQDNREVYSVVDTAFRDHWGYIPQPFEDALKHWQYLTLGRADFDPALYFLAVDDNHQLVGVALCRKARFDLPGYGWVDHLAVLREWRGRGLGMALLLHAIRELYQRGYKGCALDVDTENLSGALRLYEKAGMRPISQSNIYFKTLRDGVELKE